MIWVGYQGIGKSSISGNGNIDLESGNFWVDNERPKSWVQIYCNIAEHLSKQNYNVFMSSHKEVREELNKRNTKFVVIFPTIKIKDKWLKRLEDRYNKSKLEKDYKALMNCKEKFEENICDLMKEKNTLQIDNIDYDLKDLIERLGDEEWQ